MKPNMPMLLTVAWLFLPGCAGEFHPYENHVGNDFDETDDAASTEPTDASVHPDASLHMETDTNDAVVFLSPDAKQKQDIFPGQNPEASVFVPLTCSITAKPKQIYPNENLTIEWVAKEATLCHLKYNQNQFDSVECNGKRVFKPMDFPKLVPPGNYTVVLKAEKDGEEQTCETTFTVLEMTLSGLSFGTSVQKEIAQDAIKDVNNDQFFGPISSVEKDSSGRIHVAWMGSHAVRYEIVDYANGSNPFSQTISVAEGVDERWGRPDVAIDSKDNVHFVYSGHHTYSSLGLGSAFHKAFLNGQEVIGQNEIKTNGEYSVKFGTYQGERTIFAGNPTVVIDSKDKVFVGVTIAIDPNNDTVPYVMNFEDDWDTTLLYRRAGTGWDELGVVSEGNTPGQGEGGYIYIDNKDNIYCAWRWWPNYVNDMRFRKVFPGQTVHGPITNVGTNNVLNSFLYPKMLAYDDEVFVFPSIGWWKDKGTYVESYNIALLKRYANGSEETLIDYNTAPQMDAQRAALTDGAFNDQGDFFGVINHGNANGIRYFYWRRNDGSLQTGDIVGVTGKVATWENGLVSVGKDFYVVWVEEQIGKAILKTTKVIVP